MTAALMKFGIVKLARSQHGGEQQAAAFCSHGSCLRVVVVVGIYITVCTARERATSPCLNFSWLASILSRSYR